MAKIEFTGEVIKSAISRKIKAEIPTAKIYKEKPVQSMLMPSYYIEILDVGMVSQGNGYFMLTYQMCIRYNPKLPNSELNTELECQRLYLMGAVSRLQIPFSGNRAIMINAQDIEGKVTDNVLQVYFTYDVRVRLTAEDIAAVKMNLLSMNIN